MKTKTPKQRKQGAAVRVKDLEPKKNPKAGADADKIELNRAKQAEIRKAQALLE